MTKGGASSGNQNKWSAKRERKNVINFIEIFSCHVKCIQPLNQKKTLEGCETALRMFFSLAPVLKSKLLVISMGIRCYIVWNLFRFGIGLDCLLSTKRFSKIWINNGEALRAWHTEFGSFDRNFFGWAECSKIKTFSKLVDGEKKTEGSFEWDNFQLTFMPFKYEWLWFTTVLGGHLTFKNAFAKSFLHGFAIIFQLEKGSTIHRPCCGIHLGALLVVLNWLCRY